MNANDGGFKPSLALTVPELRRIEESIRANLAGAASANNAQIETIRAELTVATASITSELSDMRSEFVEIETAAKEIESQVSDSTQRSRNRPARPSTTRVPLRFSTISLRR